MKICAYGKARGSVIADVCNANRYIDTENTYSVKLAAELTGLSERAVRAQCEMGRIHAVKIANRNWLL